jgi:hypothetical protein
MQSTTFREWLAERGCHFHQHERGHGHGHVVVSVEREGRTAELPLVGSHERLDPALVRDVCDRLGLDWNELPGPMGRA